MAAPELPSSEFDRAPDLGAEGRSVTEPENFQQNQLPGVPSIESEQNPSQICQFPASYANEYISVLQGVPSIVPGPIGKREGAEEGKGQPAELNNQPESIDCHISYLDMKEINWKRDLSSDGQWLFRELLIGAEDIQLLERYAEADQIDLNAAIEELDRHNLIDRNDPGFFHLPWKRVPPT